MTEQPTVTPVEAPGTEAHAEEPAPETDWKSEARKWETRAKENSDAAKKLAAIEEASKTESERQAERLNAAEKAAQDATREALRYKIAAKFQVSDDDAELFLTGTDEVTLIRQAERLAQRVAEAGQTRPPKPDPNQGRPGNPVASTARDQFAAWSKT